MVGVYGDVLSSAVGVAVSPIPIVGVVLMLLSPKARVTAPAYAIGWVLGVAVSVAAFAILGSYLPSPAAGEGGVARGVLHFLIALALAILAFRVYRKRQPAGETVNPPSWMVRIETMPPVSAAGLGFVLASINPKNLVLTIGAGISIGQLGDVTAAVAPVLVFVFVASLTILGPVVAYLCAAKQLAPILARLRVWLLVNNATIMAVLLVVLAFSNAGKAIDAF